MKKCIYLAEGECEEKLVKALKEKPSLIAQARSGISMSSKMYFPPTN